MIFRCYQPGNMTEYLLPALLIGTALLGTGLFMASNMIPAEMAFNMYQAKSSETQEGKTLVKVKEYGQNPYLQTLSYRTASGEWVQVPNFPMDVPGMIEVNGGHGTTDQLIAAVEALVAALVASNEITPDEGNLIRQLSNRGHDLGAVQQAAETLATTCGSNTQCMADGLFDSNHNLLQTLFRNGMAPQSDELAATAPDIFQRPNTHEASALNVLFGQHFGNDPSNQLLLGTNQRAFLGQYAAIQSAVNLSPASAQVLSYLTRGIFSSSLASSQAAYLLGQPQTGALAQSNPLLSGLSNRSPLAFNELTSRLTQVNFTQSGQQLRDSIHQQSTQVCQLGDGQDSGTACH